MPRELSNPRLGRAGPLPAAQGDERLAGAFAETQVRLSDARVVRRRPSGNAMSEIALKSIIPILFVRDVPTSAAFFREKLGFQIDFLYGAPPFYGSVSRDKACLHLRCVRQPNFVELAAREHSLILATVEASDVQGLFDEFKQRSVEFGQTPTTQPWGGTDFHVRDPDGNVISFVTYG